MNEKELFELIKNEKWTHKTITDLDCWDYKEKGVQRHMASLDVISICSTLKITFYAKVYSYLIDNINSLELEPDASLDDCLVQDLQGNEIFIENPIKSNRPNEKFGFYYPEDILPKKFTEPDLTDLKNHLTKNRNK